ncbi:MAG: PKD domain-containing protein [Bacteroidota bacterium]
MKKLILKYISLLLIACLCTQLSNARHIIGGDISYVCNGDGTYTFTMKIYRDCSTDNGPNPGADFDNPAVVSVFEEIGTNRYDLIISQVGGTSIANQSNITADDNPCLIIPPNVCVEAGFYEFTIPLPQSPNSYFISYQRCCRNNTINNIVNPQSSGATYTMELTPEAQALCNNSPEFNNFPPIIICANEPLSFDHSASDPDPVGNQVVYRFCAPLLGGGLGGSPQAPSGSRFACDGVTPTPACRPPYQEVRFLAPTFSASNPMDGDPQITIDPNTGVISGTPTILGQFVVGVCVEEYNNGELISVMRRDFQFNVANCEPVVDARISFDEQIGEKSFVINSCGNSTVEFENLSVQERNINEFFWRFDINGVEEIFEEWSPTITFPDTGLYAGVLVLNPGLQCGDTANIFVRVFPPAVADFEFSYDTCVAGPVSFTSLSYSEAGVLTEHEWSFFGGEASNEINPDYLFPAPGSNPVSLTVTNEFGCQDTETKIIDWLPAPPIIVIEPSIFDGCSPQDVFFNNLSFPIDSTYDIVWDLGDGTISNDISPRHVYEEEGVYDVSVTITSPIGCSISDAWDNWITVRPSPFADFTFSPDMPNNFEPEVNFFDASIDAASWEWNFDGDGVAFVQNPVFAFPDTGLQVVQLIVTHESGCKDTIVKLIDVEPQVRYFLPNAFSPNFDSVNDVFRGAGVFDGMTNFRMSIWNRWGELVFEASDPAMAWNGRKLNTGEMSPVGVYNVIVQYINPRGNLINLQGVATLIR